METLRILHCPKIVGGNAFQLAKAERALGLSSLCVVLQQSYLAYTADEILGDINASRISIELKRFKLLYRAIKDFDVVHLNFGEGILPTLYWTGVPTEGKLSYLIYRYYAYLINMIDIKLLSKLGKGIFITYQGDDARQGDYSEEHFETCIAKEVKGYYTRESDASKRLSISVFNKYADRIYYLNPDLGWVLPERAKFLPYANINISDWNYIGVSPVVERPLVIHAPSHQGVKGTGYILEAVERLKNEGISFDFKLIEKMSNSEAKKIYEKADILIDQLICGWYGGLAVELMALGKPVICYMREGDFKFISSEMKEDLPLINSTKETIYSTLKEWLTIRKNEMSGRGLISRKYVEKWHDPVKVAAVMKKEYEDVMAEKKISDK